MLYRLLLVDDEKVIRDGLEKAVDWHSIGFSVAGKSANGRQALDFIEENPVDVVLTDIRMPIMSGIELVEVLCREHPEIRTLILSGYSEFEYARSAITHGVCGYVLKPSKEDELVDAFVRVRHLLDAQNEGRLEAAFASAIQNNMCDESGERLLDRIFADHAGQCANLLHVAYVSEEGALDSQQRKWCNYMSGHLNGADCLFLRRSQEISALFFSVNPEAAHATGIQLQNRLSQEMKGARFSLSDAFDEPAGICGAYRQARALSRHGIYMPGNQLLTSAVVEGHYETAQLPAHGEAAELVRAVLSGSPGDVRSLTNRAFQMFIDQKLTDVEPVFAFVYRLLFMLENELSQHAFAYEDVLNLDNYIAQMRPARRLQDIRDELLQNLLAVQTEVQAFRADSPDRFVRGALDILDSDYAQSSMSLQTASERLHISPSYLSRLFKKHTGTTFMRRLADRRIEAAKALLEDVGYRIYEIAGMVGYTDQRYFSEVFSRKTGLTPAEYRKGLKS